MSFGDAPSLRPGVGCGDKGRVSNAAGWVWAASPHSAPQPPALGSAGKPPRVPGDPSQLPALQTTAPRAPCERLQCQAPSLKSGTAGTRSVATRPSSSPPPRARPVTSVPSQAHSRGCLTRLCQRDNPRPPRWQLGSRSSAQARAAPGFCPRGVEIQTTSPPRGRAAAAAAVMNEGRDKNQAGRGRGGRTKGRGTKSLCLPAPVLSRPFCCEGLSTAPCTPSALSPPCGTRGGPRGSHPSRGRGPALQPPSQGLPCGLSPAKLLSWPPRPPQQLYLGAATCMENHGDAQRLRPSGR